MRHVFAIATAVVMLSGCAASQGSSQQPASIVPVPAGNAPAALAPMSSSTPMPEIVLRSGGIDGLDNQFTPNDGDTSAGGNGGTVDGLSCAPSMYNTYHVHAFLGVLLSGKELAVPDAIGLYEPGAETNGLTDTAHCYYAIHTHDASGMIHIESSQSAPLSSSIYTLGQLLAVWGESISSTRFGPYSGTVRVFYATTPLRNIYSGTYYQYTGSSPGSIKLYSHEAIWIEVGSTFLPASQLPKIRFYTEY